MATVKPHRKLLRVVGVELARGAPVSTFEDRIARQLKVSTRTVRRYAAHINAERDREDAADLKRARRQGRFVAMAAGARWQARADKLYDAAWQLVTRSARLDGRGGAASRLAKAVEQIGVKPRRPLDDDPNPQFNQDDGDKGHEHEIARASALLTISREDRRDAALMLKRAEQADARAAAWFEQAQKIAGTYEPEPPAAPGAGRGAPLTSPQRRAKLEAIRAALAARRTAREASA